MPNFSSLACLEVGEKFVVGGGVEHVTTVSNSNASCFRVVLSLVELRWVLTIGGGRGRIKAHLLILFMALFFHFFNPMLSPLLLKLQ